MVSCGARRVEGCAPVDDTMSPGPRMRVASVQTGGAKLPEEAGELQHLGEGVVRGSEPQSAADTGDSGVRFGAVRRFSRVCLASRILGHPSPPTALVLARGPSPHEVRRGSSWPRM